MASKADLLARYGNASKPRDKKAELLALYGDPNAKGATKQKKEKKSKKSAVQILDEDVDWRQLQPEAADEDEGACVRARAPPRLARRIVAVVRSAHPGGRG